MAADMPRIYASVPASEWRDLSERYASWARDRDDIAGTYIDEARKCIRHITNAVRSRDLARMKEMLNLSDRGFTRCDLILDHVLSHMMMARECRFEAAKHAEWAKQANARNRD